MQKDKPVTFALNPIIFARVCNSKEQFRMKSIIHSVSQHAHAPSSRDEVSDPLETVVYAVRKPTVKEEKCFHANVKIGNSRVRFQIDNGSAANIMDCSTYETLVEKKPWLKLSKSSTRLFAYGSSQPLSISWQFACHRYNG